MPVDLILAGGRIWTEDPEQPEAEALAISGQKILAVGASAEILPLRTSQTRVIDLRGRRVVPGFNDAHVHFYMGGASLGAVQLRTAKSPADFRTRIAEYARSRPKGEWILFGEWDPENWYPAELPDHSLIDDVTPDHPVFVSRVDGHTSLANALAMRLANLDRHTPAPPGGEIARDCAGNPTGIFKDAARNLIGRVIPPPPLDEMVRALQCAQKHAIRYGVTSVQDMGLLGPEAIANSPNLLRAYQKLLEGDEMKVRVSLHTPLPVWKRLADVGIMAGFGNGRLRIGGLKGFSDGSLGSATAWFSEPYTDAPRSCGSPSDEFTDRETMRNNMLESDRAGLQLAIHAIGDRANEAVLDLFNEVGELCGPRDRRGRIEHAQHLRPLDIPRFAQQGVIASMQPYHLVEDGRWADKRIGAKRAQYSWACRSLLDTGAILAFGSDWWVAPINPLLTVHAAVTRTTLDGKHPNGWVPEQKISVPEAIHAYTVGSAYASYEEHRKGSLKPGYLADLAALSNDIFSIDPNDIAKSNVDMTILDGEIVYER